MIYRHPVPLGKARRDASLSGILNSNGAAVMRFSLKHDGVPRQRTPVPLQRWHFTTLSPFFRRPLPSQFLHFCFFLMFGPFSLAMIVPVRIISRYPP